MLNLIIGLMLLCGAIFVVRFLPQIFLYALVAAGLAIHFVAKKTLLAVSWIFCAVVAMTVGLYALARQNFTNRDARFFIERFLSPQNSPHEKTFSLLTIGLMLEFHERLAEMYEKISCAPRHDNKV